MSDNTPTLTVRDHNQPCEHVKYGVNKDQFTNCPVHLSCPGGREIRLHGTRLKCFEPEWLTEDTVVWVEVDDDE